MTTDEQHILFHSLGLDRSKVVPYRNRYCTEEGATSWRPVQELIRLGYMKLASAGPRLSHFCVTPSGMLACGVDPKLNPELLLD